MDSKIIKISSITQEDYDCYIEPLKKKGVKFDDFWKEEGFVAGKLDFAKAFYVLLTEASEESYSPELLDIDVSEEGMVVSFLDLNDYKILFKAIENKKELQKKEEEVQTLNQELTKLQKQLSETPQTSTEIETLDPNEHNLLTSDHIEYSLEQLYTDFKPSGLNGVIVADRNNDEAVFDFFGEAYKVFLVSGTKTTVNKVIEDAEKNKFHRSLIKAMGGMNISIEDDNYPTEDKYIFFLFTSYKPRNEDKYKPKAPTARVKDPPAAILIWNEINDERQIKILFNGHESSDTLLFQDYGVTVPDQIWNYLEGVFGPYMEYIEKNITRGD